MRLVGRSAAAALMLAAPVVAGAQQKECTIEEAKPAALGRATLALSMAQGGNRAKNLREAVKLLTDKGDAMDNQVGRNFVLGKVLVGWAQEPGIGPVAKRGDLGYTTDRNATIDILAAADSAFTVVETAKPECVGETTEWRRSQAWLNIIQGSIAAYSAGQLDSAAALAKRSMVIDRSNPYAHQVLANVAMQRDRMDESIEHWRATIKASGTDSLFAEPRRQAYVNIGRIIAQRADTATGAAQASLAKEAAAMFDAYLAEAPADDRELSWAGGRMASMLFLAGDSAAARKIYAPQLASPEKYDDMALVQAGAIAARSNQPADAAKLFEAALAKNPYDRDALNNLAASYYGTKEYAKMTPIIKRLIEVDPSNPDNWMLYVYAYSGMIRGSKDAKANQARTDSLVMYNDRVEKMPVKVSFTQFTRGTSRTALAGTIENRGTTPKTYQLKLEFLDASGTVVATQEVAVDAVAPKTAKPFSVTLNQGGIVAYRYAPLS